MQLIDFVLHIDRHLNVIVSEYGTWTYVILFLIIFCETGLVVTPILPGDSLLFAVGAIAASSVLDVHVVFVLLSIAGVLGDSVNYGVGAFLGPKVFHFQKSRWFNPEHLKRTHNFYEKYGGKTIILARFIPIIRTFAPFVAGIGKMTYRRFFMFNVVGAVLWISLFVYGGFYFGNLPLVKKNFGLVIIGIIVLSIMPPMIEYLRHRFSSKYADAREKGSSKVR